MIFYPPAGERIGYLITLCHDRIVGTVKKSLSKMGLSMLQYRLLWLIKCDHINRSQAVIATRLELTPAALSRIISDMIERGWVCQIQNPGSKREKFIKLTDKGKEILTQASQRSFAIQKELLAHVSEDDQKKLKRLLKLALRDQVPDP